MSVQSLQVAAILGQIDLLPDLARRELLEKLMRCDAKVFVYKDLDNIRYELVLSGEVFGSVKFCGLARDIRHAGDILYLGNQRKLAKRSDNRCQIYDGSPELGHTLSRSNTLAILAKLRSSLGQFGNDGTSEIASFEKSLSVFVKNDKSET
jgi:hypothetical protein